MATTAQIAQTNQGANRAVGLIKGGPTAVVTGGISNSIKVIGQVFGGRSDYHWSNPFAVAGMDVYANHPGYKPEGFTRADLVQMVSIKPAYASVLARYDKESKAALDAMNAGFATISSVLSDFGAPGFTATTTTTAAATSPKGRIMSPGVQPQTVNIGSTGIKLVSVPAAAGVVGLGSAPTATVQAQVTAVVPATTPVTSTLTQTMDVGGMAVPIWGVLLVALSVIYLVKKG